MMVVVSSNSVHLLFLLFYIVGQKETIERFGMNSPYFIHGYVVPRMFGYAEEDDNVSVQIVIGLFQT